LLDFSRIESGGLALSFAPVDLSALTAAVALRLPIPVRQRRPGGGTPAILRLPLGATA
jgi:hypothetical protein